jgi:hypothetical protein
MGSETSDAKHGNTFHFFNAVFNAWFLIRNTMLLILFDSLLMLFVTINLGILGIKGLSRLFRAPISSDPLGLFLMGLILSTVYFNLLSFWLPVNGWTLLPLLALSSWMTIRHAPQYQPVLLSLRHLLNLLRTHRWPAVFVGILLLAYWLKPSTVPDSAGYHSTAILWYETFRVVPGLGNLHGRLAFNPASFIIEAAWSLTGLTGQAIYPLNGLLTVLFLLWIFVRVLRMGGTPAAWVYLFLLILLYGPLLAYMSSPSSDPLVQICIAYPVLRLFEQLLHREKMTLSGITLPLLVALYAPVAKISAYPMALLCLYIFLLLPRKDKKWPALLLWLGMATCIYLPWIGRNYVLSGYLAYPVPFPDLFHPDWKIPREMLNIDYYYGRYSSRTINLTYEDFRYLDKAPFWKWFTRLLPFKFRVGAYFDLLLLAAATFSPLLWLLHRRKRPHPGVLQYWLIIYACAWIWITTSMEYRYGIIFLLFSFILPLLSLSSTVSITVPRFTPGRIATPLLSACLFFFTLYYVYGNYRLLSAYFKQRNQPLAAREGWLVPFRLANSFINNRQDNFPFRIMHSGWKLYQSDSTHSCLNADLPCQKLDYGWENAVIEMRGNRLDQGFKCIKVMPAGVHR